MGPEAEFFVFDDVRMKVSMNEVSYKIDSQEGPYNSEPNMTRAMRVTAPASREDIFRRRRSTACPTCGRKC